MSTKDAEDLGRDSAFDDLLRRVAAAPDIAVPLPTHLGREFGRYRLEHELGHGGMASVYMAQLSGEHGFGRWVAIKVIHTHLTRDGRFVRMFLDEARVVSKISHPHVCQVHDFGTHEGVPYLVMEYLRGETLSTAVRRVRKHGGMPIAIAARIMADIAHGLHAAHEATDSDGTPLEIVHRDVNPSNIVVTFDGVAKILDFGVAKARGRMQTTSQGEVKGKLPYMAPEQLTGQMVDRRSDVWALGVTLWEATTGKRLFKGQSEGETVTRVTRGHIPRPSEVIEGYPPALEEAVMACLVRNPMGRTQDAAALADAIESFLHGLAEPVGVRQVGAWMMAHFDDRDSALRALERAESQTPRRGPGSSVRESSGLPETTNPTREAAGRRKGMGRRLLLGISFVLAVGATLFLTLTSPPVETGGDGTRTPDDNPPPSQVMPLAEVGADPSAAPGATPPATDSDAGAAPPRASNGRRRARAAKRARSQSPGRLSLYVVPSAEVWLDGEPIGETPLSRSIPPGRHAVLLRTDDGRTRRLTITVDPGETLRRSVTFD